MDLCKTHRATKEAVCLTCFEQVCFACAFYSHSEHRTISLNQIDDEMQKVTNDLRIGLASFEGELEIFRAHIRTQEYNKYETSENELQLLTKSASEQFQRQRHHFEAVCQATISSGESEVEHYKKLFEEVETAVNFYHEAVNTVLHQSHFSRLQYLNELTSKIDTEEAKLNECEKYFLNSSGKNQILPASVSAKVVALAKGPVLGAVKVTHTQMIMIRNHQDSNNYIHLACLSCDEPNILLWEKTFEITKDPPLIVMANTLIIRPQGVMVLIAFGRKLLAIEIHLDVEMHCAFFQSGTVIELNIPRNAHITGIAAASFGLGQTEVFTSDSTSGLFHTFDTNFNLSKRVECDENSQVLACIKNDEVYKIVASVNSLSASILRGNVKSKDVKCVGRIENTYHNRVMFLKSILFDGTFFSALWVSKIEFLGDIIQWRVVAYDSDGVPFQVSAEGECEPEVEPVSISHIKNKTLLCFSDGSIKEFCTGGLANFDFPGTGQLDVGLRGENPGAILTAFANMLKAALE